MFEMVPFKRNNDLTRRGDYFDHLFSHFFDEKFLSPVGMIQGNFKVDLKETEDSYMIEADLPGVPKDSVEITYENNYLAISAKREESVEDNKENYVRRERYYGEFKRSFYVDNVNEANINATFNDGVLKIALPKEVRGKNTKKRIDIH